MAVVVVWWGGAHNTHEEWQKIEFLKTMRSICRVKPDEKAIFIQTLFQASAAHCQPEKNKGLFKGKKSCKRVFWASN